MALPFPAQQRRLAIPGTAARTVTSFPMISVDKCNARYRFVQGLYTFIYIYRIAKYEHQ